jgi:hypothetical protein
MSKVDLKNIIKDPKATAILTQFKNNTDPNYMGPGTWDLLHRLAFKAKTSKLEKEFIDTMKEACYGFNCLQCREHCTDYIKNNPLEEYTDSFIIIDNKKMKLGLFIWTWKFHNSVNARLGKPIMSWDTAYNLYSGSENLVCTKTCMHAK